MEGPQKMALEIFKVVEEIEKHLNHIPADQTREEIQANLDEIRGITYRRLVQMDLE